MILDGLFDIDISLGRSSKQMIENSKTKFDFPSAEELRQSNKKHLAEKKECVSNTF
jgi:hypothetical protein